jgi:hypothetical protein
MKPSSTAWLAWLLSMGSCNVHEEHLAFDATFHRMVSQADTVTLPDQRAVEPDKARDVYHVALKLKAGAAARSVRVYLNCFQSPKSGSYSARIATAPLEAENVPIGRSVEIGIVDPAPCLEDAELRVTRQRFLQKEERIPLTQQGECNFRVKDTWKQQR